MKVGHQVALFSVHLSQAQFVFVAVETDWVTGRIDPREHAAQVRQEVAGQATDVREDDAAGMQALNHQRSRERSVATGGLETHPSALPIPMHYDIAIFKSTAPATEAHPAFNAGGANLLNNVRSTALSDPDD